MSSYGYVVYILPNPTAVKSGDYILVNKNFVSLYDLKTISGESSVGNRLPASKGHANRVILNITSNYNPRRLMADIKNYFDSNSEAKEVISAHRRENAEGHPRERQSEKVAETILRRLHKEKIDLIEVYF